MSETDISVERSGHRGGRGYQLCRGIPVRRAGIGLSGARSTSIAVAWGAGGALIAIACSAVMWSNSMERPRPPSIVSPKPADRQNAKIAAASSGNQRSVATTTSRLISVRGVATSAGAAANGSGSTRFS